MQSCCWRVFHNGKSVFLNFAQFYMFLYPKVQIITRKFEEGEKNVTNLRPS